MGNSSQDLNHHSDVEPRLNLLHYNVGPQPKSTWFQLVCCLFLCPLQHSPQCAHSRLSGKTGEMLDVVLPLIFAPVSTSPSIHLHAHPLIHCE